MELGNLAFGNSRGEAKIPRTPDWEQPLLDLIDSCGLDHYGHLGFENEVFLIMPYQWSDCTCGAQESEDNAKCMYVTFMIRATIYNKKIIIYHFVEKYEVQNARCNPVPVHLELVMRKARLAGIAV